MGICYLCGKETDLPFTCSYCGLTFCDEHRLPEQHNCSALPERNWQTYRKMQQGMFPVRKDKSLERYRKNRVEQEYKPKRRKLKYVIASVFIIGIIFIGLYVSQPDLKNDINKLFFNIQETINDILKSKTVSEDSESKDTITVLKSEKEKYEEFVAYSIQLINEERTKRGLNNVTLSDIGCGQKRSDNMLEYNYMSHWDVNGLKPYMRYTLSGGIGCVSENVAWQYSTGYIDLKETIRELTQNMIYEDAEWNWGHRDNILDPFHNKVSIGISWDLYNRP